jgi:hypothetical protein
VIRHDRLAQPLYEQACLCRRRHELEEEIEVEVPVAVVIEPMRSRDEPGAFRFPGCREVRRLETCPRQRPIFALRHSRVEPTGLEPVTFALPARRSPS